MPSGTKLRRWLRSQTRGRVPPGSVVLLARWDCEQRPRYPVMGSERRRCGIHVWGRFKDNWAASKVFVHTSSTPETGQSQLRARRRPRYRSKDWRLAFYVGACERACSRIGVDPTSLLVGQSR
jgi:hypothetical protein